MHFSTKNMIRDKIKVLKVVFGQDIFHDEIPFFRGAVIDSLEHKNVLFHNHVGEGLRYSYPLIQYKRIGGKAAIVCVEAGTEAMGEFFASCNFDVMLRDRPLHLEAESVKANQIVVQVWNDLFDYQVRKWLPLNKENYVEYQQLEGIVERYQMLEKILTGNILSMAKGLGVRFDRQVEVKLTELGEPRGYVYKGVKMMAFDAAFKSNVTLPSYLGLGKGVSLGYGMVVRKGKNENNEK